MSDSVFLAAKVKVGYQNRQGTYTGKLAYVVPYDEKGKLRKERSFESWRHKSIEPQDFDNVPTSGFVLNKKVGGYDTGWNHRQTYSRIYDPRGFEFEITIPNLLYILENCDCIKGKGLVGDFVYGWDGTDLFLMPTCSPDYENLQKYNEKLFNKEKIGTRNIKIGATYLTNKNQKWIYLGKYDLYFTYNYTWYKPPRLEGQLDKQVFYFYDLETKSFEHINSLSGKIIATINDECCSDYANIMDSLESKRYFSPLDPDKDEWLDLNEDTYREGEEIRLFFNNVEFRGSIQHYYYYDRDQREKNVTLNLHRESPALYNTTRSGYPHYREEPYYERTKDSDLNELLKTLGCKEAANNWLKYVYYDQNWDFNKEDVLRLAKQFNIQIKQRYLKNGKKYYAKEQ